MPNKKFQSSFKHPNFILDDKLSKKKSREELKPENKANARNSIMSWAVFIPTVIVLILCLSFAIFPALITRSFSPVQGLVTSQDYVNPFEPGILAAPLIIVNLIVLGIGILYYKKKIPVLTRIIHSISNFELSKRKAMIAVIVLIAIFIGLTAGTLEKEETWVDYKDVKERVQGWDITTFIFGKTFEPHIRYLLLSISLKDFGNIRIIPFLASVALLVLTYFFTKNITQKRFAGLVSMGLLLQSQIFLGYSTTASYDNIWILMYLFSLYLIQKFWPPSPVSFILSIFSKALTVAFLPMTLYFIARSTISKKSKIISLASYGIITIAMIAAISVIKGSTTDMVSFNGTQFWQGFSAMAMQMRFDYIIVLFLLPLIVMLFFASRKGVLHADSIMIFILVILLTAPLLLSLTTQTNQPYRFVLLSVFFAIGVGILLSKRTREQNKLLPSTQKPI